MHITASTLFNDTLPQLLSEHPEKAKIGGRYQIVVKGEGAWILDANGETPTCKAGTEPADCTLTTDTASFQSIVNKPSLGTLMGLYFSGKLKIDGNIKMAMERGNKIAALFGAK